MLTGMEVEAAPANENRAPHPTAVAVRKEDLASHWGTRTSSACESTRLTKWLDVLQSHGFPSCSLRRIGDIQEPEDVEHSDKRVIPYSKRSAVPSRTRVMSMMTGLLTDWLWAGDRLKHNGCVSECKDRWHVFAVSGCTGRDASAGSGPGARQNRGQAEARASPTRRPYSIFLFLSICLESFLLRLSDRTNRSRRQGQACCFMYTKR